MRESENVRETGRGWKKDESSGFRGLCATSLENQIIMYYTIFGIMEIIPKTTFSSYLLVYTHSFISSPLSSISSSFISFRGLSGINVFMTSSFEESGGSKGKMQS